MRKLKIIIWILKILIVVAGVGFLIAWAVDGELLHKPYSYLATIILPFLPDVFSKITKFKLSNKLVLAYEIFLIFSMIIGIDLDFYKTFMVTDGWSYYDKIIHFVSGIFTAFFAKEILTMGGRPQKLHPFLTFLFIVGITALMAVLWECFEFGYDQLFRGSMQELVSVGVADTMWDLITALLGGTIAALFLKNNNL